MKTKLSSVLCVVLMSWPISGFTQFVTFGDPDCGQWIKNNSYTDKTWLLGQLTGKNGEPRWRNPLNSLNSAEQAYLYVDNYCRNNPLGKVSSAGYALFLDLYVKSNTKEQS